MTFGEALKDVVIPLITAGTAVMVVLLNRFFFASRFTIDAEGFTARYPLRQQRARWSELRRFVHDTQGGLLSPSERLTWRARRRSIPVLFGMYGDSIVPRIDAHLQEGRGTACQV